MDWTLLFSMQKELDDYIRDKHDLLGEDLFQEKYVALLVELGELANETRCFKFWSTKSKNETEVILEEYVDNIHFILSLGIEKGYQFQSKVMEESPLTETRLFSEVFEACVMFNKERTEMNYESMFKSYLQLGYLLGFSEEDIQVAYFKKNEVNYERQNSGY